MVGSGDALWLYFEPVGGNEHGEDGAGIQIIFSDKPTSLLAYCRGSKEFQMPAAEMHVWTFAKTDCCLMLHCNGILIVDYEIKSSDWAKCSERWGQDMFKFKFPSTNKEGVVVEMDNASVSYRPQPKGILP